MSTKLKAGTATSGAVIDADTTGILELQSGSTPTTAITVDASQNVGIGITPSAWRTSQTALQLGNGYGVITGYTANSQVALGANYYIDSGNTTKYIANYASTIYDQTNGVHSWLTAPSGTAGTTATFTERMRIDTSGNLLVGTTTANFPTQTSGGANIYTLGLYNSRNASATSGRFWNFGCDSGSSFIVYTNAGVGQYMAYGATSWTANSDERLKTQLKPFENAVEKLSSLRAGTGRYLTDDESVSRSFLIAQDVQKVLPEAVNIQEDEMGTLGLQYQDLIPLLVASIKELKAEIDTLKGVK